MKTTRQILLIFVLFTSVTLIVTEKAAFASQFPPNVQLLAVGGRLDPDDDQATADVDVISIASNEHGQAASLPTGLTSFGRVSANNNIYIIGGWSVADKPFRNDFLLYDVPSNEWKNLPKFPLGILTNAVVVAKTAIYVLGGQFAHRQIMKYTYKYDLIARNWERIDSLLPMPDVEVSCAVTDKLGKIYLVKSSGDLFRSTDGARTWTKQASMAQSRYSSSCVVLENGTILVTGGTVANSKISTSLASAEMYDISKNEWSNAPSMSKGRTQADAVVIPNTNDVVVCGGIEWPIVPTIYADCELFSQNQWTTTEFLLNKARFEYGLFVTQK